MIRKNVAVTIGLLTLSTLIAFLFHHLVPENSANIASIYILALIFIARYTDHYIYGILASLVCVICVNFLFTYPYFRLNFTLTGYPITFIEMLTITLVTSTTTSLMKRQEQVLKERDRQLAEADKEKLRANLLRAVSHDLRTPLTSIIGTVNNMIENDESLAASERLTMEQHIKDDSNWLLNMVENLLSVTRIQNGDAKLNMTLEPVEEVVSEAVSRLKKRVPDAVIHVSVPEEFIMLPMDAMLIEQVIMNLLENAFVHSGSSEPIALIVEDEGDTVRFRIRDNGVGIEESRLGNLFDGLPSDHATAADSRKGMGIGLSICKTIILAHGGTIEAKNREKGAEFSFCLLKDKEND